MRSLRALLLFGTLFASYAIQFTLWRASGGRLLQNRWARLHEKNARRLLAGFTTLRGVYIKLGQVISVLGTFLPKAYGETLEQLQDDVASRPFAELEPRLTEAFGAEPLARFANFDREPLAAASLAQVHRATTADGRAVAVKILYPGIEELLAQDLRVIRWTLPILHHTFGFKQMGNVVEQLADMLARETDYENERQNVARVRAMLGARQDVIIPEVLPELSCRSVLTLSYETGTKLNDVSGLDNTQIDREALASTLTSCYLTMLLEHRTFHADPHPGNFLARGNQLVILDFGAVETISEPLAEGMKKVIMGGLGRNATLVLEGIEEMGFVAENGDRALLDRVGREYLSVLSQLKIENFANISRAHSQKLSGFSQLRGRLRAVAASLRYPEGYFYVERTVALLFGVVGQLSPERGLLGVAAPHASKALMRSFARRPKRNNAEPEATTSRAS